VSTKQKELENMETSQIDNIDPHISDTGEPVTPTPTFGPRNRDIPAPDLVGPERPTEPQGFGQRERDLKDYLADLEERKARSQEHIEKRLANKPKELDVIAEIDLALANAEARMTDFEQSFGKVNQPLIDAKLEVSRLEAELASAQAKLAEIEAKGDSATRLQQAVLHTEGAVNGLRSAAEEKSLNELIVEKFGWLAPRSKITPETLKELKLDISIQSLQEFIIRPTVTYGAPNVEQLQQRLDHAGKTLAALRDHLSGE
jgi:chromosome segregation ATPase